MCFYEVHSDCSISSQNGGKLTPSRYQRCDLLKLLARAVLLAYDFSGIATIVDLGGGEGELLRSILEFYPRTRGTVFDLPNDRCSPRCTAKNAERFSYVSGNFFDSIPERADVPFVWRSPRLEQRPCRGHSPKSP